jgi:hypothetical protein
MNWESLCRNADRLLFQQLTINQQNQQERRGAATPKEENMTKIQATNHMIRSTSGTFLDAERQTRRTPV